MESWKSVCGIHPLELLGSEVTEDQRRSARSILTKKLITTKKSKTCFRANSATMMWPIVMLCDGKGVSRKHHGAHDVILFETDSWHVSATIQSGVCYLYAAASITTETRRAIPTNNITTATCPHETQAFFTANDSWQHYIPLQVLHYIIGSLCFKSTKHDSRASRHFVGIRLGNSVHSGITKVQGRYSTTTWNSKDGIVALWSRSHHGTLRWWCWWN